MYSCTVSSVSGGLENSQSGRRLRLQTLARRDFLLSTCGLLCYTGTLRMGGLNPINLDFLSSICCSHLPELYCGALLAHFLAGDTEKYGGFLCSERYTLQSWFCCRKWFLGLNATFRGLQTAKTNSQRMPLPHPPLLLLREGQLLRFSQNNWFWTRCNCFSYLGYTLLVAGYRQPLSQVVLPQWLVATRLSNFCPLSIAQHMVCNFWSIYQRPLLIKGRQNRCWVLLSVLCNAKCALVTL